MKRFLVGFMLIVLLVVSVTSIASAETVHIDSPIILNSSWDAKQAYGKSAIRIVSFLICCLVITGAKALFKSDSKERDTEPNQEEDNTEHFVNQSEYDNKPAPQKTIVSSNSDRSVDHEKSHSLSQIEDANAKSTNTQETIESITSNDSPKAKDVPLYCRKCGNKLFPDSVFCDRCGAKIEEN